MTRTAHCSCGALRVEVSADPDAVVACHCGECQRRTGSVFGRSVTRALVVSPRLMTEEYYDENRALLLRCLACPSIR